MKIIFAALLITFASLASAQKLEEKPLGDVKPVAVNGAETPAPAEKPATAPIAKTPNSVAVTDLSIKREVEEFFYDEKSSTKPNLQSPYASTPAVDAPMAQLPSGQAPSEATYSKQFGTKRVVSYGEVRGLNADLKAALIRAGYKVVHVAPNVAKENEDDNFFNLKKRIANGDFHDAAYVLHGTVVSVDTRSLKEPIQGTTDYAYKFENSIVVEFVLINTESLQVSAAFNAMGAGQDLYLGKANAKYVPNTNRVTKELLSSFSQDAQKKLLDQLPPIKKEGILSNLFSSKEDPAAIGDPATLKVYTPSKSSDKANAEKKDPVTIYKK